MNIFRKPKLDKSTGSAATLSANGSKVWASEMNLETQQSKPSGMDSSVRLQADSPAHSFTFGTLNEQPSSSTECNIHGPFSIKTNGNIGQEILDADGLIIAWTTDPWVAQVICKLMTDYTNNENKGV